jgi:hypothetical protein
MSASPLDEAPLRVDEEPRAICEKMPEGDLNSRFDARVETATRVEDFDGHLLRHRPDIVHFSGHGSASGGLCLEDPSARTHLVAPEALSDVFEAQAQVHPVRVVVFNNCFSEAQARAVVPWVDCAVGMTAEVGDDIAIAFAYGF